MGSGAAAGPRRRDRWRGFGVHVVEEVTMSMEGSGGDSRADRPLSGHGPLELDDIADLRAYERVRERYRAAVMANKRLRRISLGPVVTVVFESIDTVRFQVQEMARAERIASDEGIRQELEVYNRLLPTAGELSATLFIELTSEEELRKWLPALVGIERHVVLELSGAPPARSIPEASHAAALSREDVTPAVHYLRIPCTAEQRRALSTGHAVLLLTHPAGPHRTPLEPATCAELVADLEGSATPIPVW